MLIEKRLCTLVENTLVVLFGFCTSMLRALTVRMHIGTLPVEALLEPI
ncbi:hypothetical protein OCAR_5273 [Afipia carboxidovorans OM5]|nr:hypothetical protein OCAR_5273 [Afipia carboxidovorans OM5]